jgi:serine/threonine protein kinase
VSEVSAYSESIITSHNEKKPEIDMINQYRILEPLGEGSFGEVKLTIDIKSKDLYAIKTINKERLMKHKVIGGKNSVL